MAMTVNGLISSEKTHEDFFSDEVWEHSISFFKNIGCVIWGRKTYEQVCRWTSQDINQLKDIKKVIVSSSRDLHLPSSHLLAQSPREAIDLLSKEGFQTILVSGGSRLNTSFLNNGLIDEIFLAIDSVLLGRGTPIFSIDDFEVKLELLETKVVGNGKVVELHYKVKSS